MNYNISTIFVILIAFSSCEQCINGIGDYTTRTIHTGDFNEIVVDGKYTMEYSHHLSDSSYIEISGFPNYLDSLVIENKNQEMRIRIREGNYCNDCWIRIKVFIKDSLKSASIHNVYYSYVDSSNKFIDNEE